MYLNIGAKPCGGSVACLRKAPLAEIFGSGNWDGIFLVLIECRIFLASPYWQLSLTTLFWDIGKRVRDCWQCYDRQGLRNLAPWASNTALIWLRLQYTNESTKRERFNGPVFPRSIMKCHGFLQLFCLVGFLVALGWFLLSIPLSAFTSSHLFSSFSFTFYLRRWGMSTRGAKAYHQQHRHIEVDKYSSCTASRCLLFITIHGRDEKY